jgi:8-oxo-dGTP pyrophosphatase MutT (NUDIX family)
MNVLEKYVKLIRLKGHFFIMYDENKAHYISVTGIIIKDNKFLITKRSPKEKTFPSQWTVPGGKLELKDYIDRPKDTASHWYNIFESVLRREVMEETCLSIKNIRYLTSMSFIRPDGIPTVIVSLFADYDCGEVKLCPDLVEYAWVDLEEANKYELIEGIYEELEMLENMLRGKPAFEWKKK